MNDLSELKATIRKNRDKSQFVRRRDANGATIFHLAYLYERYEIARYLVQTFPEEALLPYSSEHVEVQLKNGDLVYVDPDFMLYTGIGCCQACHILVIMLC